MKTTLIIMPGSPALIHGLAPGDITGAQLLDHVRALFSDYIPGDDTSVDLVGSRADAWYTAHTGSLRAWGAPHVQVGGGNYLPELIQRYALGAFGQQVRAVGDTLSRISPEALTLVALDGSTGLTPRAPSSLLEGADEVDRWCRALLSGEQPGIKEAGELIHAGVREPHLWLELVRLASQVTSAELVAADTSHGVGRYVAVWTIELEETEGQS